MSNSINLDTTDVDKMISGSMMSESATRPMRNKSVYISEKGTNYLEIAEFIHFMIVPPIAFFGLIGNACAIIIFARQGLEKTSNILMMALNFADMLWLQFILSVPKMLIVINDRMFPWSYTINEIIFVMLQISWILHDVGYICTMFLSVIIVMVRLIAVFFPFHFPRLVTPLRLWIVVGLLYMSAAVVGVMFELCNTLIYHKILVNGTIVTLPMLDYTDCFLQPGNVQEIIVYTYFLYYHLTILVPVPLTLIGGVLIVVKVTIAIHRRQRMAVSEARGTNHRTVAALMGVCLGYVVSGSFAAIIFHCDFDDPDWRTLSDVLSDLGQALHSSTNFIVYMAIQGYFWKEFRGLLTCKICRKGPDQKVQ